MFSSLLINIYCIRSRSLTPWPQPHPSQPHPSPLQGKGAPCGSRYLWRGILGAWIESTPPAPSNLRGGAAFLTEDFCRGILVGQRPLAPSNLEGEIRCPRVGFDLVGAVRHIRKKADNHLHLHPFSTVQVEENCKTRCFT